MLTEEEERLISETLGTVSDWGFPLSTSDVIGVFEAFVTKQGRYIQGWTNNRPGYDYIKKFAERNKLTTRMATNIKLNRAAVGET